MTCGYARENADHNTQDFNDEKSCKRFCKRKGSSFAGIKLEGWRCFCADSVPEGARVSCAGRGCKVKIIEITGILLNIPFLQRLLLSEKNTRDGKIFVSPFSF